MTVRYTLDVSTSSFTSFTKVLFRWRASLWKSVFQDLLCWLLLYSILSCVYRFALADWQQEIFEDAVAFAYKYTDFIPLTFMLGFYVSLVVNRWWDMFLNIGWIDNPSLYVSAYIEGTDKKGRMIRRNIVRYLVLVQALIFRDISVTVRKRFPTLDSLEAAGLMSVEEKKTLLDVDSPNAKYWVPVQWAYFLIREARQEGRIKSDHAVQELFDKLGEFRAGLGKLACYDFVPIPLVYTQVVILTVRCYFIICLMGRQYVHTTRHINVNSMVDYYIPMMTIIQFVFYVGWLKVAEALLNPFGEDDDDFEVNWFLDRNLQVGLTVVDDAVTKQPPLKKDVFWADPNPEPLYSAEAASIVINPLIGSATEITPRKTNEGVVMVPRLQDDGMQTDGELGRGSSFSTSLADNTGGRGLKDIVRGKLTRLGSTINAQLQGRTASSNVTAMPSSIIVENGGNFTKVDDSPDTTSTTVVINEQAEPATRGLPRFDAGSIGSASSANEAKEQVTLMEERGTMTDKTMRQSSVTESGRAGRHLSEGDSQGRTNEKDLPAVIEEDEAPHHNEETQTDNVIIPL
uniref:Bestrophin homolog n=1 Tax=Plectus sambesii TaxID=2011161 RepID=A0A914WM93_9BILA